MPHEAWCCRNPGRVLPVLVAGRIRGRGTAAGAWFEAPLRTVIRGRGRPDCGQPIRPQDAVIAASMQALLIRPTASRRSSRAFADSSPISARSQAEYRTCNCVPACSMLSTPDFPAFSMVALTAGSSMSTASPVRGASAASFQTVTASAVVDAAGAAEGARAASSESAGLRARPSPSGP